MLFACRWQNPSTAVSLRRSTEACSRDVEIAPSSRRLSPRSLRPESEDEDDDEQYNTSLEVTPRTAACFVVFASTMLVTLYFLISDVMYAVVLAF